MIVKASATPWTDAKRSVEGVHWEKMMIYRAPQGPRFPCWDLLGEGRVG